jgi:hypothetical protein
VFQKLSKQIEKIKRLSEDDLMKHLSKNVSLKENIVNLNTQDQLYNKGIDSNNITIGEYSNFTKDIKQRNGQRFDHITLNDTGAFYDSFKVYLTPDNDFLIYSDPIKDDTNLIEEYGEDIIGLTEDNLDKIRNNVRILTVNYIKNL